MARIKTIAPGAFLVLYQRLGGEAKVRKIVKDVLDRNLNNWLSDIISKR